MTPRPRSIHNHVILDHARQLLVEHGRDAVTFAQVAQRCGLAPPTLVQRFATREAMLGALATGLAGAVREAFARSTPGLAGLQDALRELAPTISGALSLGATIGLDQFSLELRKQISYALLRAVDAGELPHCDVAQLARSMQVNAIGAVATARLEQGDAGTELVHAVENQLASYV